jgi:2-polyprenyl-3-methyl-5-hydroxy-6-metoxy-1,4-benzoquinol methylase
MDTPRSRRYHLPVFDPKKAEAFAARMLNALNGAGLCLMASIGHRTGLFDAMRGRSAMTPAELAAHAGLNERYIREWLGAMVAGGVVEVEPSTLRYSLPAEHAAFLTRAAAARNIAASTQYVAMLGSVEDEIVECFRQGGGVPYDRFARLHDVMAEGSAEFAASSLESRILPLVPGLAARLGSGIRVLDAGCGLGRILIRLAELSPCSRFVGMDLSEEAIQSARAEASAHALGNVEFIAADLGNFDETAEPEAFDLVTTFDAVHDQARPLNLLKGIHRTLRPDGIYLMQDIKASSLVYKNAGHPIGTFLYTISCMHCMTVSLAQGGEGLGAMWGEEKTRDYLARAGFRSVEKHELPGDIMNDWYVVRK